MPDSFRSRLTNTRSARGMPRPAADAGPPPGKGRSSWRGSTRTLAVNLGGCRISRALETRAALIFTPERLLSKALRGVVIYAPQLGARTAGNLRAGHDRRAGRTARAGSGQYRPGGVERGRPRSRALRSRCR